MKRFSSWLVPLFVLSLSAGCASSDAGDADGTAAGGNALSGGGGGAAPAPATQTLKQVATTWAGHSAFDKLIDGKGFWDQPAIVTAMQSAMGSTFFPRRLEIINGPQEPIAVDPDDPNFYVVHTCKQGACNEVALDLLIDVSNNVVKVLWDETGLMIETHGDQGRIVWLDKGQEVDLQEGCQDSVTGADPATTKLLAQCLVFDDKNSGLN
jgi:hypothetical protein